MSQHMPFGADTLSIPFTREGNDSRRWRGGMSRMRPRGELFRYGVVSTADVARSAASPPQAVATRAAQRGSLLS